MSDQRRSSLSCLCSEHFLSTQFRLASDRFSPVRFDAFPCFFASAPYFLCVSFSYRLSPTQCLRCTDRRLGMPCLCSAFLFVSASQPRVSDHSESDLCFSVSSRFRSPLSVSDSSPSRSSRCFSDPHRFPSDHFFSDSLLSAQGGSFQVRCVSFASKPCHIASYQLDPSQIQCVSVPIRSNLF